MRPMAFSPPPMRQQMGTFEQWVIKSFQEVSAASHEQVTEEIADSFTLSNVTETRTLDPTTATVADVANVLGTFLQDMQRRAVKEK